jgi:hypothetical protein
MKQNPKQYIRQKQPPFSQYLNSGAPNEAQKLHLITYNHIFMGSVYIFMDDGKTRLTKKTVMLVVLSGPSRGFSIIHVNRWGFPQISVGTFHYG